MLVFRSMALRRKLVVINMVTCGAVLLLVTGGLIVWQWRNLKSFMISQFSTQAEMIADSCKAALSFEDVRDAEETLKSLKAEPSVVLGCVYNDAGKLFAGYHRPGVDSGIELPESFGEGHIFNNGFLAVFKPVIVDDDSIGTVCLVSDMAPLHAMLKNSVYVSLGVLFFAFFVAYLLSSKLRNIISSPILNLTEVATIVSNKKDYSIRAQKHGNDEVGFLIDAFNEMLEQIQRRDSALVDANEKLTAEVIERMKAEKALEVLNRDLNLTLEKMELSNRELKDFAYVVAHDLKTPLRGISTLAKWLAVDYKDKIDTEGREQLDLLLSRVGRMHNLIEAILQYSRIGYAEEEKVDVDLNFVVREAVEVVAPPENIRITVKNNFPAVKAVQTHILQVFQNLLSNAVKYMDKPQGYIEVGCLEEEDFWKFSVADNGPGIEEKYFEKVFQIFETLSQGDEFESTGIGLTVIKKIVEMYGGKVWIESEVGNGCTFFFTFPKQKEEVVNEPYEANIAG